MTPKEKAEELVLKFKELPQEGTMMCYLAFEISKQCALIAVGEILNLASFYNDTQGEVTYWTEVKQEIQNKH